MKHYFYTLMGCLLLVAMTACEKDMMVEIYAPKVETGTATEINREGVTLSGSVQLSEHMKAERYGILLSELQSMAEYNEITVTSGETDFSMTLQNLEPGKTYYFCTYAYSGLSMVLGKVSSFTTLPSSKPVFDDPVIIEKTENSFTITTTLFDAGGSELTVSGFCYNELGKEAPTSSDKVENVELLGDILTATISGLNSSTTYQVRAYGVNNDSVGYSNLITVTTEKGGVPFFSTVESKNPTANSITLVAKIIEKGSTEVTEVGFCYSTNNQMPNVYDEKISLNDAIDTFEMTLKDLTPNETYYIRAYAINKYGTGYSDPITYTPIFAEVAYICEGKVFNKLIKQLADNNENLTKESENLSINRVKFATEIYTFPEKYIIVSTEKSPVPIYASFTSQEKLLTIFTPARSMEVADASSMFSHLKSLRTVDFGNFIINEKTISMWSMFEGCESLTTLDVSDWNTSNVEDMSDMFGGCESLSTLDVSGWDTSNVKSMYNMFANCTSLTTLDVSDWNTSNVEVMPDMFYGCESLSTLDVSGWDTSNVEEMSGMFVGCMLLTTLDVSGWDTSNVEGMSSMFVGCMSLSTLDLSSWDTSNVKSMSAMFYNCTLLENLDVSGWDTSNVEDMDGMFADCTSLTTLDVSGWNTSSTIVTAGMFYGCESLSTLDVSGWDTSNVEDMSSMFEGCSSLTSLDVSGWDTSHVTDMRWMFSGCSSLTSLDVSSWSLNKDVDLSSMFWNCSSTSKSCEITASKETQEILLSEADMTTSYFTWKTPA